MKIKNTKFITGVIGEHAIMYDNTPHIAFVGRSNVGKSTTINALLGRRSLVKTGRTPGKTREINFFEVETDNSQRCYFVDLPGYGYAKLSKNDRLRLEKLIKWYLSHPKSDLALVVLIIDAKAGLTELDKEMISFTQGNSRELILAVNKIDKVNQKSLNQLKKQIESVIPDLKLNENIVYYSALKDKNIHTLRNLLLNGS